MNKPNSFAEKIALMDILINAVKRYPDRFSKRGFSLENSTKFENFFKEVTEVNQSQEKAKSDLKMLTEKLESLLNEVDLIISEIKKIVKMEFPKEQWKEFGFDDKK